MLSTSEYDWFSTRLNERRHVSAFKSYAFNKDLKDFSNTIKIFYKKAHQ
jgi:hypothetical protein